MRGKFFARLFAFIGTLGLPVAVPLAADEGVPRLIRSDFLTGLSTPRDLAWRRVQGPDGSLYVVTDSDKIWRAEPK